MGGKLKNLNILKINEFKVPKFIYFSDDKIPGYLEINELTFPLIMRSSFNTEDGKKFAFAGIFESYFPIYDEFTYKNAIKKCILSTSENLKLETYMRFTGNKIEDLKGIYVLQEFIIGDFSGVCFTKYNEKIYIEIVPGLNFGLLNGEFLNPLQIIVNRNDFKDFYIKNLYSEQYYYLLVDNVVKKIPYTDYFFEDYIVDNFLGKLCKQFMDIEVIFNHPQDIEFTIKGKDIFILQSRNITTN